MARIQIYNLTQLIKDLKSVIYSLIDTYTPTKIIIPGVGEYKKMSDLSSCQQID